MAENITNDLIYEVLKKLQVGQVDLQTGQRLTNERLAAIEHHIAGFHVTISSYNEEIVTIKNRLDYLEKRLEIRE